MRLGLKIQPNLKQFKKMSKYIDVRNKVDDSKIEDAAKIIKNGGLVVFPTETVYGIGANGLNQEAIEKIYIAKRRKQDNPLILLVSNRKMLEEIVEDITQVEEKLIKAFWPGPLTIIFKRKSCVPDIVTGGLDTVGVRLTSGEIALKIIQACGFPIAAPSANVSGKPSGTSIEEIFEELKDKVDCILDAGKTQDGLESTVVRVIDGVPTILRPGKITPEQIENVVGCVKIYNGQNEKVLSPGMSYKHYAPNAKCILVYSDNDKKMIEKIKELAKEANKVTIISCQEHMEQYEEISNSIINIGAQNNWDEISKNIFSALREVDKINPDLVVIEGVKQKGIGLAIMNRLIKACGNNYIEI